MTEPRAGGNGMAAARRRSLSGRVDLPQLTSEGGPASSGTATRRSASASAVADRGTKAGRSSSIPAPRRGFGSHGGFTKGFASNGDPSAIQGLEAVLFLDVDGVLHPVQVRHPRQQFARSCMALLGEVLAATGATIVLSTAWRVDPEARRIVAEKLAEHGLPHFVSRTPNIAMFHRSREILSWVRKYRPATWVAVDDLPLGEESEYMQGHFVQTRPRFGLLQDSADRIIQLFKAQAEQLERQREKAVALMSHDAALKQTPHTLARDAAVSC